MAKELARIIGGIVVQKRVDVNSVPNSLYIDAKEFFELVSQYLEEGVPRNPPASANAYMIATRAIRIASQPQSRAAIRQSLGDYLKFFNNIKKAGALDESQLEIAVSLQKFLDQLYRDGQAESYVERVKFKERLIHA
jgi:hypothetical protein